LKVKFADLFPVYGRNSMTILLTAGKKFYIIIIYSTLFILN
jgi:hypothetical protein